MKGRKYAKIVLKSIQKSQQEYLTWSEGKLMDNMNLEPNFI